MRQIYLLSNQEILLNTQFSSFAVGHEFSFGNLLTWKNYGGLIISRVIISIAAVTVVFIGNALISY